MAAATPRSMSAFVTACFFVITFSTIPAEGLSIPGQGQNDRCKEDGFWDHGTEKCESCCDICCHATVTRTLGECDAKCPGYRANTKAQKEKPDTREVPSKKPTNNSIKNDAPVGVVYIALAIVTSVTILAIFGLTIVKVKRQSIFSRRAEDRSGADAEVNLPLQTVQEAPTAQGHHMEASDDAQATPLKTPVQESGEGYREAAATMDNTEPKRILPSSLEESAMGYWNDRCCPMESE
ncbi:uncharacterized protein [Littorina saxatilis]|uniref:TNFR-Cys domain-containing protein n=1 Tax=Littorina saxatilis TaxID=31220 RepID=A0AAN9AMF8_9CAEN